MTVSLRGGGVVCGTSANKVKDIQSISLTTALPMDFATKIRKHTEAIDQAKLTSIDDKGTLMNSFQYFFLNENAFNILVLNQELAKSHVDLLEFIVPKLMDSARVFVKANQLYCYLTMQIVGWVLRVLFWFYSQNGNRYLKEEQQQQLIGLINQVEEQLRVEQSESIYDNSIRYEVYVAKAVLTILPNDSKEGEEILKQFTKGAIESVLTMSISEDLLTALSSGVMYVVNEGVKMYQKNQYKQIQQIEALKWQIMDAILTSQNSTRSVVREMAEMYKQIKDSSWEIQYCWIKSIGSILCLKPTFDKTEVDINVDIMKQLRAENSVVPIDSTVFQVNLDAKKLTISRSAKQLYHQIECLGKLADVQMILMKGSEQMPNFEAYNPQYLEHKFTNNQKISSSQYFITKFKNLQLDYFIKRISEAAEMTDKIAEKRKVNDIKMSVDPKLNSETLEVLFIDKEKVGQLISKLMEINNFYISISFILDQWIQFANSELDLSMVQEESFMLQIIINQLKLIQNAQQFNRPDSASRWTTPVTKNRQSLKEIKRSNSIAMSGSKEQLITIYNSFQCGPISGDINGQIKDFTNKLQQKKPSLLDSQALSIPSLEYGIKQSLIQCALLFEMHKSNIQTLLQIKVNIDILIAIFQDFTEDHMAKADVLIQPVLKLLDTLSGQLVKIVVSPSENLLQLTKQINQQEYDQLVRKFSPPSDDTMKTYQLQYYDSVNINLPMKSLLIAFDKNYQFYQESKSDPSLLKNFIMKFQIKKLQQILQDITYYLNGDQKFKSQFIEFMKSLEPIVNHSMAKESVDFWVSFFVKVEQLNNKPQAKAFADLQVELETRQQKIQVHCQQQLTINPYDQQATDELEQEDNVINEILKHLRVILEIQRLKPKNFNLFVNNLVKNIVQAVFSQQDHVSQKLNNQQLNNQQGDQKLLETVKYYDDQFKLFVTYVERVQGDLQTMNSELDVINEVESMCQNTQQLTSNYTDWFIKVMTYKNQDFKNLISYQIPNCIFGTYEQYKCNISLQYDLMQIISPNSQGYISLADKLEEIFKQDRWKIRECMALQLMKITDSCLKLESKQMADMILLRMKVYESNKRVRKLLNHPQYAQQLNQVLSQYWPSQQEIVVQQVKMGMKQLNNLLYELQQEQDPEKKKLIQEEYRTKEGEIQTQLQNVQEIGNALGITMLFIQDLKKSLVKIDQKISQIQENVTNLTTDVQFLRGKTVYQLFELRKNMILRNKKIVDGKSIYIKIRCVEKIFQTEAEEKKKDPTQANKNHSVTTYLYNADPNDKDGEINEFLEDAKKTMLIHGQAGSGKSTASRKIEEYIWELFDKTPQSEIKLVPIIIQLPSLRDPAYSAMNEALKSETYRFDLNQIRELKEEIENKKIKLLIIMDSYDELHQDHISKNLVRSNKLSTWGHKSIDCYPKILITTRSEVLNKADYHEWFLAEGSDTFQYYKEVRLERFDKSQQNSYIDSYLSLSVKKVLFETFILMANIQNEIQQFETFTNYWQQFTKMNFIRSKSDLLLSESMIQQMINAMLQDPNVQITNEELKRNLKVQLQELKSGEFYKNTISLINIEHILETPFMMEIVVQVLPTLIKQKSQPEFVKRHFIEHFSRQLQKVNPDVDVSLFKANQAWAELTKDQTFFENFSITMESQQVLEKLPSSIKTPDLREKYVQALMSQKLTQYDFYKGFFDLYFEKQINKLKEQGIVFDFVSLSKELWKFAKNLAVQLSAQHKTQVEYKAQGLLFKKEKKGWEDLYFDDDCKEGVYKKMFRSCIPIKQSSNTYSFNHKSLQEFLVAKDLVDTLEGIAQKSTQLRYLDQEEFEISKLKEYLQSHFINSKSWSVDFMKGACSFVIQRVSRMEQVKQLMFRAVELTKQPNLKLIQLGSNCLFLLQRMRESFMDRNIQGINIQDIDLSGSNFAHCNLDNSSFDNVNISGMNVFFASLRNVKWSNIYVSQLPPKEHSVKVKRMIYQVNGNLVLQLEQQLTAENGEIMHDYGKNIVKSIHWTGHDHEFLFVCFEKSISSYDLNRQRKPEEQTFNAKILKTRASQGSLLVLLANNEIHILKCTEITSVSASRKMDVKQCINHADNNPQDIKLAGIWSSKDNKIIIVQSNDLYQIEQVDPNSAAKGLKAKKILRLPPDSKVKYSQRRKLGLINKQRLFYIDNDNRIDHDIKEDCKLIYLSVEIQQFIIFTKNDIQLFSCSDLKQRKCITHSLDIFSNKKVSHNSEMLVTLHANKVAIWNVKAFEQIQILTHSANCCSMDREIKVLALGSDTQLHYQDLKSLTSQKQLNFKFVMFANQSPNFLAITTENEIYYFNVQGEIKWNLLNKPQGDVFLYISPNGERGIILSKTYKIFTIFDLIRGTSEERYGFCKANAFENIKQQIIFIKGNQLFLCAVKDQAMIASPWKNTHQFKSSSYFQITRDMISVTLDDQFYQYDVYKNTQSTKKEFTLGKVTNILSNKQLTLYVLDNKTIVNNEKLIIYQSTKPMVDAYLDNNIVIIAHSKVIRVLELNSTNAVIQSSVSRIEGVKQVRIFYGKLFAMKNENIEILNLETLAQLDIISIKATNMIQLSSTKLGFVVKEQKAIAIWDLTTKQLQDKLIEQKEPIVNLMMDYNQEQLILKFANQISILNINTFKGQSQKHEIHQSSVNAFSQLYVSHGKVYLYWIDQCQLFRQHLNCQYPCNVQMVADFNYEFHSITHYQTSESLMILSDSQGGLHLTKDSCKTYQQFKSISEETIVYKQLTISADEQTLIALTEDTEDNCQIWNIKELTIKSKLPFNFVQNALFLNNNELIIHQDSEGLQIFSVYNIETTKYTRVSVLKKEVIVMGVHANGFTIAHKDSSIDFYEKRKHLVQQQQKTIQSHSRLDVSGVQEIQEVQDDKAKFMESYVRMGVFNSSSNQPIQSYDTDCNGAYIQSHIKYSLVELFSQPSHAVQSEKQ